MGETGFEGGMENPPSSVMDSSHYEWHCGHLSETERMLRSRTLAHPYPYPTYTQMRTISLVYSLIYVVMFPI